MVFLPWSCTNRMWLGSSPWGWHSGTGNACCSMLPYLLLHPRLNPAPNATLKPMPLVLPAAALAGVGFAPLPTHHDLNWLDAPSWSPVMEIWAAPVPPVCPEHHNSSPNTISTEPNPLTSGCSPSAPTTGLHWGQTPAHATDEHLSKEKYRWRKKGCKCKPLGRPGLNTLSPFPHPLKHPSSI